MRCILIYTVLHIRSLIAFMVRYQASHPFWYRRSNEKRIHKFGPAMVADSLGHIFRPGGLQRQQQARYQHQQQEQCHRPSSPAPTQDQPPDVLPYPTDPTFQSQPTHIRRDDEQIITQETILKIQELKRLIYRYSQYHRNPGAVLNCIVYYCNNGDNTLLDEKLEQLRSIDTISKY